MSYYDYIEEVRDEDVPEEVILKKHTLPQLPDEIIDMILYKFGGLRHKIVPTLKLVRELAFKAYEKTSRFGMMDIFIMREVYRGSESPLVVKRQLIGIDTALDKFVMNILTDGERYQYDDYTYSHYDTYDNRRPTCYRDIFVDGNYVKHTDATIYQIFCNLGTHYKKWRRHLVSNKMSVKQLKELLDMNEIYYPKSASKKKLLEAWYGFKEW